jgi:O-acetyl-ADP-ribose deacetylase (regulator of RNase III)
LKQDISKIKNVNAIVTSTNEYLQGNSNGSYWRFNGRINVDGAIRNAVNQEELEQQITKLGMKSRKLDPGKSILTNSSGRIMENNVHYIIHTVTPGYLISLSLYYQHHYYFYLKDGTYGYDLTNSNMKLRECYSSCLELADKSLCESIAFPALGTGVKEWVIHIIFKLQPIQI